MFAEQGIRVSGALCRGSQPYRRRPCCFHGLGPLRDQEHPESCKERETYSQTTVAGSYLAYSQGMQLFLLTYKLLNWPAFFRAGLAPNRSTVNSSKALSTRIKCRFLTPRLLLKSSPHSILGLRHIVLRSSSTSGRTAVEGL